MVSKKWRQFLKDDLSRDAFIMFSSTSIVNVFNLLYSLFLLRNLAPIEFGLFNSLLSLVMLFSQFPGAAAIVLTRFVSQYHAQDNLIKIKKIIISLGSKVALVGILVLFTMAFAHTPIANFLKVPDNKIFLVLSLAILSSYANTVPIAALQGLQRFLSISVTSISTGLIKLILVVLLVKIGFGVTGALNAFFLSNLCGALIGAYFLKEVFTKTGDTLTLDRADFRKIYQYFIPVFLMTLVYVSLLNIDIILVKHFFSPLKAGYYSVSQVVGKIVFFFSGAIVIVMFPKVANLQAKNMDTRLILKKSLIYIFILSGAIASLAVAFPETMLRILARKVYPECIPLVRLFSVNMVILSMLFMFLNYYLSLNAKKYLLSFLIAVILEIILISVFHQSLTQVLVVIFACFFSLFILNIFIILKKHPDEGFKR